MKVSSIFLYFIVSLFFISKNIFPASIDGTTEVKYLTTNQVFHNNQYARGYVTLNSGATILSDATAFLNINTPLKGGLDLRETGTLSLEGDLYIDTNFTLSGSGVIRGNGKTIFLNGNLTIPDNSVIHINSNSIIDGQGHDLVFGRRGRIFVDTNITLTLRNMKIVQDYNDFSAPCIRLASFKSQLALNDVEFALSQDFLFPQGELFIHGDVTVTGTSAFIYQSTQHSFIASNSTFYFDKATTFSVTPATITDCKFDQWPTYTSNRFIVMADQTSRLLFNEASLCSTPTGCRFTKGFVKFKNQCNIKSNSSINLPETYLAKDSLSINTELLPSNLKYSPDGSYLAVVNKNSNTLQIFDSVTLVQIGSSASTGNESYPVSVSWSNTSTQLAVINMGDNTLKVFNFSGVSTPTLSVSKSTGSSPSCCAWSTWGKFIAVTNSGDNTLQIFKSDTLAQIGANSTTGTKPSYVAWAPGDQYLAVTNSVVNTLQIFSFDYVNNPVEVANHNTGLVPSSVSWSNNGLFLSVVTKNSNLLQIFSFDMNLNLELFYTIPTNYEPVEVSWSPNCKYVGIVNSIADTMQIFSFADVSQFDQVANDVSIGSRLNSMAFSPNNNFIAVVNNANLLQVFPFAGGSIGAPYSASTIDNANSVSFSPDGNFISVLNNSDTLLVYPFTGVSIGAPYTAATGIGASAAAWSPAGNFIAVVNADSSTLQVFPFSGSSIGIPYSAPTEELGPNSVSWSPDGEFIAVTLSGKIQVFPFSESSIGSPFEAFSGPVTTCSAWSPDGNFLAVGNADVETQSISIFEFNSSSGLSRKASAWITDTPVNIKWSPDGREIAVGQNGETLQIFSFNGSNKLIQTGITFIIGSNVAWSFNNNFLATNGKDGQTLNVYSINPIILNNDKTMSSVTQDFPISISWASDNFHVAVINQNLNSLQIFDMINPNIITEIAELGTYEISPGSIEWSPDDRFVAMPFYGDLRIYSFNGSDIELVSSLSKGVYTDSFISWAPDGNFLAMVNAGSNNLQVFPFKDNVIGTPITISTSNNPSSVSFSPDGTFIAVANYTTNILQIFPFNGVSISSPYTVSTGSGPVSIAFSPNGDFISVVNNTDNTLSIFYFDKFDVPTQIGSNVNLGKNPKYVAWSPDNRFLAITSAGPNILQIYSFSGASTPVQVGNNVTTASDPLSVVWGPLGDTVAVVTQYSHLLQLYSFDGCNSPSQISDDFNMQVLEPSAIAYSHNGKFIAAISVQSFQVFGLNYVSDKSAQAISNGVVFGNSELGAAYDATVNLLAGANVNVDGLINYDCLN